MTNESPTIVADDDEETYVESVARFVSAATWLDDTHRPALKVLRSLAKVLDQELDKGKAPQAALVSQFSLTYRDLAGKSPAAAKTDDTLPPPLDLPGDWR
ncbi:hypothetical protein HUN59_04675 [Curtobacterium sp. Csp2]|uniref:hypothetical protein n=1 Tax=Curtobacterium sp. Csp2 TaxID=2495430 RepID=UPI001580E2FE|nr:hypothetical protein [Curtobacterium sp. Csp2]QKS15605.1 hypothetical protein HUN59_04675 [Curtobacterium sp. Csp2]